MKEKIPPKRPCEAPAHVENCPCVSCVSRDCQRCPLITKDHFTPKCIAKEIGWGYARTNRANNLQWLSEPCHIKKDSSTPARRNQLVFQMQGNVLRLGDHIT